MLREEEWIRRTKGARGVLFCDIPVSFVFMPSGKIDTSPHPIYL